MVGKGDKKSTLRRRVRRSAHNKKSVSTINVRGYRLAGQVFSRLLYPRVDETGSFGVDLKTLFPPKDPKKIPITIGKSPEEIASAVEVIPPNTVFNRDGSQTDTKDYAMGSILIELFGPIKGKRKGKKIAETLTESTGEFKFTSTLLELDKTYRIIVTLVDEILERVWLTFRVRKRDVRSSTYQNAEIMNISVDVSHEYFNNDFRAKNREPKQQKWEGTRCDHYDMQAKLAKPTEGPDVLWFGGPSAILLNTFVLKVPYLHQLGHAPLGSNGKVLDAIKIRIGSDTWKLPVSSGHMCFVTCLTMVLKYYGLKVTIKDVMKATALEFLRMNSIIKNYGLSQKSYDKKIIQFAPKNGTFPYCRIDILVKTANRLFSKLAEEQRNDPVATWFDKDIHTLWRRGDPMDSDNFENTRALIGAGFPISIVERGMFDAEWYWQHDFEIPDRAADVVAHGVVIRGISLNSDGYPVLLYLNDPNDPKNLVELYVGAAGKVSGYMIVGGTLKQKEISSKSKRLIGGGMVPAPMRKRLP